MAIAESVDEAVDDGEYGVAYEPLTEEECYLYAILQDPSGLDLAEFCFVDEDSEDGCFRAYPMQWPWWRCEEDRQVEQGARDVGKSMSIQARAAVHPFVNPGAEMAVTGPEKVHVRRVTSKIENRLTSIRLLRSMLIGGKSQINTWPFMARFQSGAQIVGAIPQKSGLGFKGLHSVWLETDEGQDMTEQAWTELRETLRQHMKNAQWRVHGVSTGIPDEFQKITTNEKLGWKVHRITQYHKPTFTAEELARKILAYGSKDDPDFRRNVVGEHGDNQNRIFDISRLMKCTDKNEASEYNLEEYYSTVIKFEELEYRAKLQGVPIEHYGTVLADMLELPERHRLQYKVFWIGMDIGITNDPTAIMVFAEYVPKPEERKRDKAAEIECPPEGATRFKLLARIELHRITVPDQAQALLRVVEFYQPRALSLDKTGNGTGVLQVLQQQARIARLMRIREDAGSIPDADGDEPDAGKALPVLKGYNFGEKVIVAIDEQLAEQLPPGLTNQEIGEKAGIKKQVKTWSTDAMRALVDTYRLLLPYDENLLQQLTGQTWKYSTAITDHYGNRAHTYSAGEFHAFDGCRLAILGMVMEPIEAMLRARPKKRAPIRYAMGG